MNKASQSELNPGQIWWDKEGDVSGGDTQAVHLLLSSNCGKLVYTREVIPLLSQDQKPVTICGQYVRQPVKEGDPELWMCAYFYWGCFKRYMGASIKYLYDYEINNMEYLGDIKQLKSFLHERNQNHGTEKA